MVLYILTGVLALAAAASVFRLYQYKRQMKSFIHAVQKRKDTDWNKPVTVDYFDKDITTLAEVLNSYTNMCRNLAGQYESDKKQLKNVIAGISHDFRTPLTAAKGYMQLLLKSGKLEGAEKEYLETAMDKVTYLKLLSDDFFEISSLDAKEELAETASLNVTNFLSECILQQYGWIKERGLRTDFQLPESDIFVESNEHDLKRIIENLFSNVRKYAKSYVGVKTFFENDELVLIVENDLEESQKPDMDRIFEPFYRDGARSKEGSGLGLYIVACLSKRLGIKTRAECKDGIFRIWLLFVFIPPRPYNPRHYQQ